MRLECEHGNGTSEDGEQASLDAASTRAAAGSRGRRAGGRDSGPEELSVDCGRSVGRALRGGGDSRTIYEH